MSVDSDIRENAEASDNPYQYRDMEYSFGISKGCSYLPKSDFGLELMDFVKAGSKTGYICSVNRQFDQQKRICYFTTSAVHKKVDFITQINSTFGSGGLVCSFSDKELSQYINWKKWSFHKSHPDHEPKEGILFLGKQKCGKIWVFSKDVAFNKDGLNTSSHDYVWLKNSISLGSSSKELSLEEITCDIKNLTSDPIFPKLLDTLETCLAHNYLSCILMMGAGVMSFHYQEVLRLFRFCPQVMATGPVSTGKSVSMQAALCLFGADNTKNHYMKCSKAFCLQRAAISTLPFGIDDPSFPVDLNEVVVSFYNGTISANVMYGSLLPLTCPIYCSNFTFGKNERISSRALLIPFNNPKVGPSNLKQAEAFQQLPNCLEAASSMAGALIQIEKELIDSGRVDILEVINPMLFDIVGVSNPRVVTGCSILLYFTYKMLEHGLDQVYAKQLKGQILQFMLGTVLPSLVEEENVTIKDPITSEDNNIFDQLGNALLKGCADLDLDKCSHFIRILTQRKGEDRPAIAIRFENIPFDLPLGKEKFTSKIRQSKTTGENNCAFYFRNTKAKAVLIYLDVFSQSIQENMINKFKPDLQQKSSKPASSSLVTQQEKTIDDEPLLVTQRDKVTNDHSLSEATSNNFLSPEMNNNVLSSGKEMTNDNALSPEKEMMNNDVLSPGKEMMNDDALSPGKEMINNDIHSPGKEMTNDDVLSPGQEMMNNDVLSPGKEMTNDDALSPGKKMRNNDVLSPGKEMTNDDVFSSGKEMTNDNVLSSGKEMTNDDALSPGNEMTNDDALSPGKEINDDDALSSGKEMMNNDALSSGKEITNDDVLSPTIETPKARKKQKRKMIVVDASAKRRQTRRTNTEYVGEWSKDLNSSSPLN